MCIIVLPIGRFLYFIFSFNKCQAHHLKISVVQNLFHLGQKEGEEENKQTNKTCILYFCKVGNLFLDLVF